MKKKMKQLLPLLLFCGAILICTSSTGPIYDRSIYSPVFMERSELERSVFFDQNNHDLVTPGKIYCKGDFIFINEKYKGIHIIDNSNPKLPRQVGFINAPGCLDLAIKGNMLYLDNAVDLVAFDLSSKTVTERIKNVFPEPMSPANDYYHSNLPANMILVGWRKNK